MALVVRDRVEGCCLVNWRIRDASEHHSLQFLVFFWGPKAPVWLCRLGLLVATNGLLLIEIRLRRLPDFWFLFGRYEVILDSSFGELFTNLLYETMANKSVIHARNAGHWIWVGRYTLVHPIDFGELVFSFVSNGWPTVCIKICMRILIDPKWLKLVLCILCYVKWVKLTLVLVQALSSIMMWSDNHALLVNKALRIVFIDLRLHHFRSIPKVCVNAKMLGICRESHLSGKFVLTRVLVVSNIRISRCSLLSCLLHSFSRHGSSWHLRSLWSFHARI